MSKKIGLAVTTYTHNYGSFLQSFAMSEVLKKLGYEPEVISTGGVQHLISAARRKYFMSRIFNVNELKSYSTVFKGMAMKMVNKEFAENLRVRGAAYDTFRDEHFAFSPVKDSWAEVGEMCKGYHAVLVGSDQLWRPANIEGNYYTLNFVPDEVNKIAYATSFGIPFCQRHKLRRHNSSCQGSTILPFARKRELRSSKTSRDWMYRWYVTQHFCSRKRSGIRMWVSA